MPGWRRATFEVRDNGVLQRVDLVYAVDVPVNAVLYLGRREFLASAAAIRGARVAGGKTCGPRSSGDLATGYAVC